MEQMQYALGQSFLDVIRNLDPMERLVVTKDVPETSFSPMRVRVCIDSITRTYHTEQTDILERAIERIQR